MPALPSSPDMPASPKPPAQPVDPTRYELALLFYAAIFTPVLRSHDVDSMFEREAGLQSLREAAILLLLPGTSESKATGQCARNEYRICV